LLIAALTLGATGLTRSPVTSVALISVALAGLYSFKSPFWSLPGLFPEPLNGCGSIAAINSIGQPRRLCGPYLVGVIKSATATR